MPELFLPARRVMMIAYCGLNCSECPAYIATQANDDNLRADCARKWTAEHKVDVKPESINCDGCKSEGMKFFVCQTCGIRKCASEKGIDNCSACDGYACRKLQKMWLIDPNIKTAVEALRKKAGA
jgi:hypothetical protein